MRRFSILIPLVLCFCSHCGNKTTEPEQPAPTGVAIDVDNNLYLTIKIGDQTWMMENLKVTHYRNGDAIINADPGYPNFWWFSLRLGALCDYNFDESNRATYGCLYNWYAVNDPRGLAPDGWHVASDADYKALEIFLGMSQADADAYGWRGMNVGKKMKEAGDAHWYSFEPPISNTDTANESGFTALPGGYIGYGNRFEGMGLQARFWLSTANDSGRVWYRELEYFHSQVYRGSSPPEYGFSVRCVKD